MTSGIIEILVESSAVVDLVGTTGTHVKVFPVQAPEKTRKPYIVVSEVALNPSIAKGCAYDLDKPRYTVNVYSYNFRETELIQNACRAALDTGAGFSTDAGVDFDQIWMVDRQDLYMPSDGQDPSTYVKVGVYECMVRH